MKVNANNAKKGAKIFALKVAKGKPDTIDPNEPHFKEAVEIGQDSLLQRVYALEAMREGVKWENS